LSALLFFLALDLALVAGAVILLLVVIVGRGRSPGYLALAALLVFLALGVWYVAIRGPSSLP
jgi:hypothetical protein